MKRLKKVFILLLMIYRRRILIVLILIALPFCTWGQGRDIKGYNEVSVSIGIVPTGVIVPWFDVLYTYGWHFGDYFGAGLGVGYSSGAASLLSAEGIIPFKNTSSDIYLQARGGMAFYPEIIPLLSGSAGMGITLKNHKHLRVGPTVNLRYGDEINDASPLPSGEIAWRCVLIGFLVGWQF